MSYLTMNTNTQTVTIATEIALVTSQINLVAIPPNQSTSISGVVNIATGTGGTAVLLKVRRGTGIAGTQVGANFAPLALAANSAQVVAYEVIDPTPPADGVYTVTLTFTANTSAVVVSTIKTLVDTGILND